MPGEGWPFAGGEGTLPFFLAQPPLSIFPEDLRAASLCSPTWVH